MRRRDLLAGAYAASARSAGVAQPNILWITCEDLSPLLGCYGDRDARTPNLDKLAGESVRYENAYSTAPVCSPSRSCLITGQYAHSLGSMHLRGVIEKPPETRCFPEYLREAGYYTSNNVKEDYNFAAPKGCWDESSDRAHWRKRAKGQPFFSVFNIMLTHQGQIRYNAAELAKRQAGLPAELRSDGAKLRVPPYFPDTPAVRNQLAALYTQATLMDRRVGEILRELEEDGLARETVVFFYSDHGTGLPRGKRFLHSATGLRVPLLIRRPGAKAGVTKRLVTFVDFAPTALSLAGIAAPGYMQGQAFLGAHVKAERRVAFAARDRVDEEIEMSRTAFDGRWQYIRNYLPHRPVLQHGAYSEVADVWKALRAAEEERGAQPAERQLLAKTKAPEELYDLRTDPLQLRNLAGRPEGRVAQRSLGAAMRDWMLRIGDRGLWPEAEMRKNIGKRVEARAALAAAEGKGDAHSEDVAVRYWTAIGLLNGRYEAETARAMCRDASNSVRRRGWVRGATRRVGERGRDGAHDGGGGDLALG
jgi:N-sulfoglucosamine sulfohydrolase